MSSASSKPTSKPRSLKRLSLLQSPTSLSSPSSSSFGSPDVTSRHVDIINLPDELNGTGAHPSPVSSVSSPTSTTRPLNGTSNSRKNSRRQSSIYYVSQDHREQERVRSPANERRFSALQKQPPPTEDKTSDVRAKRRSLVGTEEQSAPVTLAEKHADLLRFIAQKESRCLELRSQLATEESELLALKRKWEQIVSRQVKRSSSASLSSIEAESSAQNNVLAGIKEGVQEVGRLLAQLSDLGVQSKETDPSGGHVSNSSISTTTTTTSSSSTRLSQSSMSSLGMIEDETQSDRVNTNAVSDIFDTPAAKRHSLSTAIRRKPYEPSSPSSPSPPISTPRTPLSASPFPPNHTHTHTQPQPHPPPTKPARSQSTDTVTTQTQAKHIKRLSAANAGPFPPASSIPGVNVAPLASWVEGVGKRAGKRASTLFSSLTSPTWVPQATMNPNPNPRVLDLSAPDSPSLLDDDDALGEGSGAQWAGIPALSPERLKVSRAPVSALSKSDVASVDARSKPGEKESIESVQSDDDSEEWNW